MECLAHSKDAIGQLYRAEAICLWAAPRPHPLSSVKKAYYAIYFIRLKPSHKEGNSDFQVQPLFKFSQDHCLLPFIEYVECWASVSKWSLLGRNCLEPGTFLPRGESQQVAGAAERRREGHRLGTGLGLAPGTGRCFSGSSSWLEDA